MKIKNHIKNQRGAAPVLELFLVVVLIGVLGFVGYRYYQSSQKQSASDPTGSQQQQKKAETTQPKPAYTAKNTCNKDVPAGTYETTNKPSPDGVLVVELTAVADWLQIDVVDKAGKTLACGVPTESEQKAMGLGSTIKGQYGLQFGSWLSNSRFTIKIVNAQGNEYTWGVDAKTGKVDINSYKRVK